MSYPNFEEIIFSSADELWDELSPTKRNIKRPEKVVYRGQANADWGLLPSILRDRDISPASKLWGALAKFDQQMFSEMKILKEFVDFCDQIGIKIPNDSQYFREVMLSLDLIKVQYIHKPQEWPNDELFGLMALAQHHGVPTRLLDWTKIPYVAAYFASSSAIANSAKWKRDSFMAIWSLDLEQINLYDKVRVVQVPGSISPHIAAQSGLFTVHPHNRASGSDFVIQGLENEFGILPDTPLKKLLLPISESLRLYELCRLSGFSGATIYPTADGAGKAVMDSLNFWALQHK